MCNALHKISSRAGRSLKISNTLLFLLVNNDKKNIILYSVSLKKVSGHSSPPLPVPCSTKQRLFRYHSILPFIDYFHYLYSDYCPRQFK